MSMASLEVEHIGVGVVPADPVPEDTVKMQKFAKASHEHLLDPEAVQLLDDAGAGKRPTKARLYTLLSSHLG